MRALLKIINQLSILLIAFLTLLETSCSKLVEVDAPLSNINAENVYDNDATSTAVLTGIYASLSADGNNLSGGFTNLSIILGLSADELTLFKGVSNVSQNAYYQNSLSVSTGGYEYWQIIYPYIFRCNSAIEGLNKSNGLTFSVKQQLIGEAKFLRAFFYFYLVNLYGDAPLVLSTDHLLNSGASRSPEERVYQQIIEDLIDAKSLLSNNYLKGDLINYTHERVRPNKWAAAALLARAYLYTGDYEKAELEASEVLTNPSSYALAPIEDAFLKNSTEAIWQLQPVNSGWNTEDAKFFILNTAPSSNNPVYLSSFLLNSFEIGDKRRSYWVKDTTFSGENFSYAYKYKSATQGSPVTEYLMVLRVAEQYLIRSEARAHLGKLSSSLSDLNIIRNRAGLSNSNATTRSVLLTEIQNERQVELFTEWGHRWLDLKRNNNLGNVMSIVTPQKSSGGTWQPYKQLYPIPLDDITKNPNLIQNEGY